MQSVRDLNELDDGERRERGFRGFIPGRRQFSMR